MIKEFEEDRVNFVRVVDHLHALGSQFHPGHMDEIFWTW